MDEGITYPVALYRCFPSHNVQSYNVQCTDLTYYALTYFVSERPRQACDCQAHPSLRHWINSVLRYALLAAACAAAQKKHILRLHFVLLLQAYAITWHRAQGATFTGCVLVDPTNESFSHGQLYVAASRSTCSKNLLNTNTKLSSRCHSFGGTFSTRPATNDNHSIMQHDTFHISFTIIINFVRFTACERTCITPQPCITQLKKNSN
jgi:hypothetical protein